MLNRVLFRLGGELVSFNAPRDPYEQGDCYQNALKFCSVNPDWRVVHGIPILEAGPRKGSRYGHAWVEREDNLVFDPFINYLTYRHIYYQKCRIDYFVRYEWREAVTHLGATGHCGPWDPKIESQLHFLE